MAPSHPCIQENTPALRIARLTVATWLLAAAATPAAAGSGRDIDRPSSARPDGPSQSSPIAVSPDDDEVWVVNPDRDTVTRFSVRSSGLRKRQEIKVGDEPTNLAISPNGKFVYVSNTGSGTVSVIRLREGRARVVDEIQVGTEPYGLAFTPNGRKLYVANARSNDVSVIDPDDNEVEETIRDVGVEPRGIAIT